MPDDSQEPPPQYTRYRAGRRLRPRKDEPLKPRGVVHPDPSQPAPPAPRTPRRASERVRARGRGGTTPQARGRAARAWRRWKRPKRIALALLALVAAWLVLSLVLFLISSHF